ncbi:MAG: alpha/beta hydrolase [Clostridia bacterium]
MTKPTLFKQKFVKDKCQFEEFLFHNFTNLHRYKNCEYERKINYCDDKNLYLNLCYPKSRDTTKLPIFIYIHGGGWISSKPENREGFVSNIVEKGFFTLNIFYGLAPEYQHPKPIVNIYKALAWLVNNASKYNLDLDNIYLGGESAGAHLIAVMGAICSNEEYKNKFNLDTTSKDLIFKGLYLICGIYDMEECMNSKFPFMQCFVTSYSGKNYEMLRKDSKSAELFPQSFVNENYPKSFIITANLDQLRTGGKKFYEHLCANNVPCKLYHCTGLYAFHAFGVALILPKAREAFIQGFDFLLS